MKKFLKYLVTICALSFMVFEAVTLGILTIHGGIFHSSYQSLIQDKYRILLETNEPKIIMVSGSSSSFGLNQKMLEEETGYKVANLGLHAGFGHLLPSELAKANINEGDIVLLGYEYGWEEETGFENLDQKLIMTGFDNDLKMYTRIPVRKWKDFIGFLFKYAEAKNSFQEASGIYSREAFDSKTGQMTMAREYTMKYDPDTYGVVDLGDVTISDNSKRYLLQFKQFIEKQGAKAYFVAPPVIDEGIVCDFSSFDQLKDLEEKEIGIPYISNPRDYIFPAKYMSNALYHCNSVGEDYRTELLIKDLKRAKVLK